MRTWVGSFVVHNHQNWLVVKEQICGVYWLRRHDQKNLILSPLLGTIVRPSTNEMKYLVAAATGVQHSGHFTIQAWNEWERLMGYAWFQDYLLSDDRAAHEFQEDNVSELQELVRLLSEESLPNTTFNVGPIPAFVTRNELIRPVDVGNPCQFRELENFGEWEFGWNGPELLSKIPSHVRIQVFDGATKVGHASEFRAMKGIIGWRRTYDSGSGYIFHDLRKGWPTMPVRTEDGGTEEAPLLDKEQVYYRTMKHSVSSANAEDVDWPTVVAFWPATQLRRSLEIPTHHMIRSDGCNIPARLRDIDRAFRRITVPRA